MKKLLSILITLMLVLIIAGCNSPAPNTVIDTTLEDRVTVLEEQVAELEQVLVDIEIIEGLNGQREYYLPKTESTLLNFTSVSAGTIELMGDELDKASAPSYVLDVDENYIPFYDVMELLVAKYFTDDVSLHTASIGFQIKAVILTENINKEDYVARLILMIDELSNYDFYIIGGSELYIQSQIDGMTYITIPVQTLRSSFITMTADVMIEGTYEITSYGLEYDGVQVKALYDGYVTAETFAGYVLDYK